MLNFQKTAIILAMLSPFCGEKAFSSGKPIVNVDALTKSGEEGSKFSSRTLPVNAAPSQNLSGAPKGSNGRPSSASIDEGKKLPVKLPPPPPSKRASITSQKKAGNNSSQPSQQGDLLGNPLNAMKALIKRGAPVPASIIDAAQPHITAQYTDKPPSQPKKASNQSPAKSASGKDPLELKALMKVIKKYKDKRLKSESSSDSEGETSGSAPAKEPA